MKAPTQLRWNIELAAREFGINPRTLSANLVKASITKGDDGQFSTPQICAAVFGDMDSAKLRKELALASQEERRDRKEARELIEASAVVTVWDGYLTHARQVIRHSELSEAKKRELLDQLKSIPVEEYFKDKAEEEKE